MLFSVKPKFNLAKVGLFSSIENWLSIAIESLSIIEVFDMSTDAKGILERNSISSPGFSVELTVFSINESFSIFFMRTVTVSFVEKYVT